jgi:hypothetical protein
MRKPFIINQEKILIPLLQSRSEVGHVKHLCVASIHEADDTLADDSDNFIMSSLSSLMSHTYTLCPILVYKLILLFFVFSFSIIMPST